MASFISPFIDWSILAWLRGLTGLPIVVKGIQCVEDAVLAYEHGVQGIVLSNHGGRSQDTYGLSVNLLDLTNKEQSASTTSNAARDPTVRGIPNRQSDGNLHRRGYQAGY